MPFSKGGSSGGSVTPSTLAGFEIGYDQITSGVSIVSTAEATPTTVITCAAHTFDGAAVMLEFFAPSAVTPQVAGADLVINLWEGASNLGRLVELQTDSATNTQLVGVVGRFRFTPTAASHTYLIQAWVTSTTGSPNIGAGAGGVGVFVPAFARFTKA